MSPQEPLAEPAAGTPAEKSLRSDILRVLLVAAFFLAALYLLRLDWVRAELFDREVIRARLKAIGLPSQLSFLVLTIPLIAIGLPRSWVSVMAGGVFGAATGFTLSMISAVIGSTINFYTGYLFLRGPLSRRLPARFAPWRERLRRNGFYWVLYLRLFPISNSTMTSLLAGAVRMKVLHFIAASAIGFIPQTAALTLLASSAAKSNIQQFVLGISLLVLIVILFRVMKKRTHPEPAPAAEHSTR